MFCWRSLFVCGLLLVVTDWYVAGQQTTRTFLSDNCECIRGKSSDTKVNKILTKMPEYTGYSVGSDMWNSVCPVNKRPEKKTAQAVALVVFWKYLSILKENEERFKQSFLFYTCNDAGLDLRAFTHDICQVHLLQAICKIPLQQDNTTTVTLTNEQVRKLNVSESLKVFQNFTECLGNEKKDQLENCTDVVFAGCKEGERRKKGKGRKRNKGKGGKRRKGKGGKRRKGKREKCKKGKEEKCKKGKERREKSRKGKGSKQRRKKG